jgi:hypothetical protein
MDKTQRLNQGTGKQYNENIFKNPFFWIYLILIIAPILVFATGITSKSLKLSSFFLWAIAQLIYNIKFSDEYGGRPFSNKLDWGYFIILLVLAIGYAGAVSNEIPITVTTIFVVVFGVLFAFMYVWFRRLICSTWSNLILNYLVFSILLIIFFGFLFSICAGFAGNEVFDSKSKSLQEPLSIYLYSASVYYANTFNETPFGVSRIISQIELLLSYLIHIFAVGFILKYLPDKKNNRKRRNIEIVNNKDKLSYLNEHLLHEFRTLKISMLKTEHSSDPQEKALSYESLLVHARLLHDFFTDKINSNFEDDVGASDFISNWSNLASNDLRNLEKIWLREKIKDKIDKMLMHISFKRGKFEHGFPVLAYQELCNLITLFLLKLPNELRDDKNVAFLEEFAKST